MHAIYVAVVYVAIVASMIAALEVGQRIGVRQRRTDPRAEDGSAPMDGVVFALFGLLLAFTFFGAGSRFDHRRELIVTEANAIKAAYVRLDLFPPEIQPELRRLFRRYVESRIASYEKLPDLDAFWAEHARTTALQGLQATSPTAFFAQLTNGSRAGQLGPASRREPGWSGHTRTMFDNPYVSAQWQAEIDELTGAKPHVIEVPWFRQNYLGEWVVDSDARCYWRCTAATTCHGHHGHPGSSAAVMLQDAGHPSAAPAASVQPTRRGRRSRR